MPAEQATQAYVPSGVIVHGDVVFDGHLTLDGTICGNVSSREGGSGHVTVLANGSIEGSVQAHTAIVGGSVHGTVEASECVTILVGARIQGDVRYSVVEVQAGAFVGGRLIRQELEPSRNVVVLKATIA